MAVLVNAISKVLTGHADMRSLPTLKLVFVTDVDKNHGEDFIVDGNVSRWLKHKQPLVTVGAVRKLHVLLGLGINSNRGNR